MKRLLGYGLVGLIAFLLFLARLAPATLLVDQFSQRLSGFSVQAIEGNAITGTMLGVSWHGTHISRVAWRWQPLSLLTGQMEFQLKVDDDTLKLTSNVAFRPNERIYFRELTGQLPLVWLFNQLDTAMLPLDGGAQINLQTLELSAAGLPLAAQGVIQVTDLRALLNQPLNLGNYQLQFAPAANVAGIRGQLKDVNAPLALDGLLTLSPNGQYQINGQIAPRDSSDQNLRQMLSLLGPPGGDGRWAIHFSGMLTW